MTLAIYLQTNRKEFLQKDKIEIKPNYCITIFKQVWTSSKHVYTCSKDDAVKSNYCITTFKQVWTCQNICIIESLISNKLELVKNIMH